MNKIHIYLPATLRLTTTELLYLRKDIYSLGVKRWVENSSDESLPVRGVEAQNPRTLHSLLIASLHKYLRRILVQVQILQLQRMRGFIDDYHSVFNFLVNLMAGLVAYTYLLKKPSIDIHPKDLPALPPAVF